MTIFTTDFSLALGVALTVGLGTYFNIPPFSSVIGFGATIKNTAAVRYSEPS